MLGAGTHLASWLNLATLTDVSSKSCEILVVNVLDVVHSKLRDLSTWGVATATGSTAATSASRSTTARSAAFTITALSLWSTEAGSAFTVPAWSSLV